MFRTTINLVPPGKKYNIYSGLTFNNANNLIATDVDGFFEFSIDVYDDYYLKFSCEGCEDQIIKVKLMCECSEVEVCTPENPFNLVFDISLQSIEEGDNPLDTFQLFLDKGNVQPNCCTICPSCDGFYTILNGERYISLYETLKLSIFTGCCLNYAFSMGRYLQFIEATGNYGVYIPYDEIVDGVYYKYSECDNGFKEKVELLKTLDPTKFNDIIGEGIVEVGKFDDNISGLEYLISFYVDNNINDYDGISTIGDMIISQLYYGIFFHCYNNNTISANRVTYLKIAEAIGLTESAAVPA